MKLLKCDNGHFYDGDKFASCPHCQAGNAPSGFSAAPGGFGQADDVTVPINGGAVPGGFGQADDVTVPGGFGQAGDITVPVNYGGAPQNFNWNSSASDVTVPVTNNGYGAPGNTVPVTDPYKRATMQVNDDDEKTQGFFNDVLPQSHPVSKAASSANDNTIAVGWLICIKGVNVGRDYKLRLGRNSIGRDESNSVALLSDTSVSRTEQAILVYEPHANKFYALPGRSSSLAYLNGDVLLSRTEMKKNDILELGKTQLMLIPCCDDKFSWTSIF